MFLLTLIVIFCLLFGFGTQDMLPRVLLGHVGASLGYPGVTSGLTWCHFGPSWCQDALQKQNYELPHGFLMILW